MIKYRKGNRVRDMIGAAFFALAATLLWVESSMAKSHAEEILATDVQEVSIRSLQSGGLDRL